MKDEILNNVTMQDIVNKYGIEHNRRKIRCPFHGIDKHPSAQLYDNFFHCFTCGKHLDVIGFVEEYFNLSFKEAMQKINIDFNLGLDFRYPIDYIKLVKEKEERNNDKKLLNKLQKHFCELCDLKFNYIREVENIDSHITIWNWAELTEIKAEFQNKLELVEIQLDFLTEEMYNFSRASF